MDLLNNYDDSLYDLHKNGCKIKSVHMVPCFIIEFWESILIISQGLLEEEAGYTIESLSVPEVIKR